MTAVMASIARDLLSPLLLVLVALETATGDPMVNVSGKIILGVATASSSEFLGIPYATHERWGKPVDMLLADLAGDTLNATAFGPCCPQPAAVYAPNQREACLNLNVFTPHPLPVSIAPVLVFIHGGGGTTGCSAQSLPPLYNGTNLLSRSTEPVVVVTINYRLSVLASLYLEGAIADNLQSRDQISALRWVRANIASFGGKRACACVC